MIKPYVDIITCVSKAPMTEGARPKNSSFKENTLNATSYVKYYTTPMYPAGPMVSRKNDADDNLVTRQIVTIQGEKERDIAFSLAGFFTIAIIIGTIFARVVYRKMALEHAEHPVPA